MDFKVVLILFVFILLHRNVSAISTTCPSPAQSSSDVMTLKGETRNECYVYVTKAISQDEAIDDCRSGYKGFLARVRSRNELAMVVSTLQSVHRDHIWVDIKYNTATRNATWSDGTYIGNKMMGQKVSSTSTTKCGALKNQGTGVTRYETWETISCVLYNGYICQTPAIVIDEANCGNRSFVYGGSCYALTNTVATFTGSQQICKDLGGEMAAMSTQEIIVATTNYLNLHQSLLDKIWVRSVRQDTLGTIAGSKYPPVNTQFISNNLGMLITRATTSNRLLDAVTTWFWRQNNDQINTALTLCKILPGVLPSNVPQTTATTEVTATTTALPTPPTADVSSTILTAVLVVTFFLVLCVLVLLFCWKRTDCFQALLRRRKGHSREKALIASRRANERESVQQAHGNLLPATQRSDSIHNTGQTTSNVTYDSNPYNQISNDISSEALYASIDHVTPYAVSNVHHATYAEIDNPLVFTSTGEPRRTNTVGAKARPRLHAEAKSPENHHGNKSQSAHGRLRAHTHHGESSDSKGYLRPSCCSPALPTVQYAELNLAADEEEQVNYARLMLTDEDDSYKQQLLENSDSTAHDDATSCPTSPTLNLSSPRLNIGSTKKSTTSDADSGLAEDGVLSPTQDLV
ncbi:uncharacterized protein LOC100184215 isoform X2 [Ciona intestinalis]